jgi:hypothetical protein
MYTRETFVGDFSTIRVQTQPDRIDPGEEKKKTREPLLANVARFALLIVLIRSSKLVSLRISHLPSQKKDYVLGFSHNATITPTMHIQHI